MTKDIYINRTLGRLRVSASDRLIHLSSSKPIGNGRYEHFGIALSYAQSVTLAIEVLSKNRQGLIRKCKHDNQVHLAGWGFDDGTLKMYRHSVTGPPNTLHDYPEITIKLIGRHRKILAGLLLMFAASKLLDERVVKRTPKRILYLTEPKKES